MSSVLFYTENNKNLQTVKSALNHKDYIFNFIFETSKLSINNVYLNESPDIIFLDIAEKNIANIDSYFQEANFFIQEPIYILIAKKLKVSYSQNYNILTVLDPQTLQINFFPLLKLLEENLSLLLSNIPNMNTMKVYESLLRVRNKILDIQYTTDLLSFYLKKHRLISRKKYEEIKYNIYFNLLINILKHYIPTISINKDISITNLEKLFIEHSTLLRLEFLVLEVALRIQKGRIEFIFKDFLDSIETDTSLFCFQMEIKMPDSPHSFYIKPTILKDFKEIQYKKGDIIDYAQSDLYCGLILAGDIQMVKNDASIVHIENAQNYFIGAYISDLADNVHTINEIIASSDCSIIMFTRRQFIDLANTYPSLGLSIASFFASQLYNLNSLFLQKTKIQSIVEDIKQSVLKRNFSEALSVTIEAHHFYPQEIIFIFYIGILYYKNKDFLKAYEYLYQFHKQTLHHHCEAYIIQACCLYYLHQYQKTELLLEVYIPVSKQDVKYKCLLAKVKIKLFKFKEALDILIGIDLNQVPKKLKNSIQNLITFLENKKLNLFNHYFEAPISQTEKEQILKKQSQYFQKDAFSEELSFGTGGARQIVGHGTNRFNVYNITRLTLALIKVIYKYFSQDSSDSQLPIVILGYDSRLTSNAFANLVFSLLKQNGCLVFTFKEPVPTPLVSYAIRCKKAIAGIVLTASHNPPEYNGYKVYWEDGGQITSPLDQEILSYFREIEYKDLSEEIHSYNIEQPLIENIIDEEIYLNYTNSLKESNILTSSEKNLSILYSPLHGTGGTFFKKAFKEFAFLNFNILKEQAEPDGNFPTLKSPNPEDQSSFEYLVNRGKISKIQLLLATDPDADRLGAAVWNKSTKSYFFLNGNQVGALLLYYLCLLEKHTLLKNPYIVKTIVTTNLQRRIAEKYNIQVNETLTGFKYIAEYIKKDADNYLFGAEESYGYLPVSWVRDKDSISSALLLSDMASKYCLIDTLYELYKVFGYYYEYLDTIVLKGSDSTMMNELKNNPQFFKNLLATNLKNRKIIDVLNLNLETNTQFKPQAPENIKLFESLPRSNVIQLTLEPEGKITIRPSGTEPKIKLYISLFKKLDNVTSVQKSYKKINSVVLEVEKEAKEILTEFKKLILSLKNNTL